MQRELKNTNSFCSTDLIFSSVFSAQFTATPAPLPAPTSPVTTPAATPPRTPPKAPTPELSPRESPVPLLLNETDLPTPAATPEHVSPEPEEEKVEETPPRSVVSLKVYSLILYNYLTFFYQNEVHISSYLDGSLGMVPPSQNCSFL